MNRARLVANYQRLMKSELDCDEGIVQVALIEADHLVCYLKKKGSCRGTSLVNTLYLVPKVCSQTYIDL